MTLIASFMGIIVKRDMTSRLRSISFSSISGFLILSMKNEESLIKEFVFPTRGFNLFARNLTMSKILLLLSLKRNSGVRKI